MQITMKKLLLAFGAISAYLLVFNYSLAKGEPKIGMTKSALIGALGQPQSAMKADNREILSWDAWKVTLKGEIVSEFVVLKPKQKLASLQPEVSLSEVSFTGEYWGPYSLRMWNFSYSIHADIPYTLLLTERDFSGGTKQTLVQITRDGCGQLGDVLRSAKKWTDTTKQQKLTGVEKALVDAKEFTATFSSDENCECHVTVIFRGPPQKGILIPEKSFDLLLEMIERREELEHRGNELAKEREEISRKADKQLTK